MFTEETVLIGHLAGCPLILSIIEAYAKIRFIMLDKNIAREAARISLTYKVPLLDAFVAATSRISECNILLSGDKDHVLLSKQRYLKVQFW